MTHAQLPAKYRIKLVFEVDGEVEKHDIIGAIFGQSEGLFGPELDLSELVKTGRVGRIDVALKHIRGKTVGTITIPSALDRASTAIIAATVEAVDRVGPYPARTKLDEIVDVREERRKWIIKRAREILREWTLTKVPSASEVVREVSEVLVPAKVVRYGPEGLPAGPDVERAREIIIVEGRADVINLLKCGITNVIAMEGLRVPDTIIRLCEQKEATAFLDGDHMGDVLLKELLSTARIRYVARAPRGREVEELTPKEVLEALAKRVPADEVRKEVFAPELKPDAVAGLAEELEGTLEAVLLDEELNQLARVPVSQLFDKVEEVGPIYALVFDGIITQRIVDMARKKGIRYLVGERVASGVKAPDSIRILLLPDIRGAQGRGSSSEEGH
ncbi:DNA primase [Candidatus Bathyarchaeota archaeon]|nr:MAG: DNA primase [Candidatus Bathyarchaeota archaeon]